VKRSQKESGLLPINR